MTKDEERAAMLTADAVTHELVRLRENAMRDYVRIVQLENDLHLREWELATLRGLRGNPAAVLREALDAYATFKRALDAFEQGTKEGK
jgi:hypothetical protein